MVVCSPTLMNSVSTTSRSLGVLLRCRSQSSRSLVVAGALYPFREFGRHSPLTTAVRASGSWASHLSSRSSHLSVTNSSVGRAPYAQPRAVTATRRLHAVHAGAVDLRARGRSIAPICR